MGIMYAEKIDRIHIEMTAIGTRIEWWHYGEATRPRFGARGKFQHFGIRKPLFLLVAPNLAGVTSRECHHSIRVPIPVISIGIRSIFSAYIIPIS